MNNKKNLGSPKLLKIKDLKFNIEEEGKIKEVNFDKFIENQLKK